MNDQIFYLIIGFISGLGIALLSHVMHNGVENKRENREESKRFRLTAIREARRESERNEE